ncbi:hypothetical protein [Cupriavidus pauculus]|uniref:Uncharacterized protein n=1 Tax=Cupriavidus pauculus TaxID=82633 RepID=A0A2N5C868_9BURK|nr:hypothetical protein [Cupriavidus pauculus]PLP98413.1 hypothetical protein CYJ10_21175 [Cupriavidus pauculus]
MIEMKDRMKPITHSVKTTIILALLVAFSGATFAQEALRTWEVGGTDADGASRVASIVENRFKKIKPSFFDSVSAQVKGNLVSIKFSGWHPTSNQVETLTQTKGKLYVALASTPDKPLITERDIEQSQPLATSEVAIRLTDSAAQRVATLTANAVGDAVIVQWDGRVIGRLRISSAPLRRDIAFSTPAGQSAQLMSAILSTGALPEGVSLKAR